MEQSNLQLAQLIHKLFQASQLPDRQIYQHELETLERNHQQHLTNVMSLLYDQQTPEIQAIKMSVGVYLRNYIRGYIPVLASESSQGLTPESLQKLMEPFFTAILSSVIEMAVKRHLFLVFESLITIYQSQQIDKQKQRHMLKYIARRFVQWINIIILHGAKIFECCYPSLYIYKCWISLGTPAMIEALASRLIRSVPRVCLDKPKQQAFFTTLLETVYFVSQRITQGDRNVEVTKGGLLIFQAVLFSLRDSRFLTKIFPVISPVLCKIVDDHIAQIGGILMEIANLMSQGQQGVLTIEHPFILNALLHLEIIAEWMILHVNTMEKWESKKYFGYQLMTQSNVYSNTLAKILSISFPVGGQALIPLSATLISVTGIARLDNLLNKIKYRCHEYLNYVYRYLFEKVHVSVKVASPFLGKGIQFCPYLINSLLAFSMRPDFDQLVDDETYSDLIIEAVDTLVLFTAEKEFTQLIGPFARPLLVHVGFNYMRTTPKEMEELRNDPEGFVNLSLDLCDKQKSHVIKTQGAKLLEAICDNVDGAVFFVTLFSCQTIHHALNPSLGSFIQTIDELAGNFYQDEYAIFKQQSLFLNSPPEIQAETSIVALTTLSYVLPRRQDLLPVFQEVLAANIDRILGISGGPSSSVLLRARMSLLLGQN